MYVRKRRKCVEVGCGIGVGDEMKFLDGYGCVSCAGVDVDRLRTDMGGDVDAECSYWLLKGVFKQLCH